MIMSRLRKKMERDVKPMVVSEILIRFLWKTTDTTNDENANPNDGFCSEYSVCEWRSVSSDRTSSL